MAVYTGNEKSTGVIINPDGMANTTSSDLQTALGDFDAAITAAGGSPAGSDTQVQFNDGGAFGADAHFTYDKTNDVLHAHKLAGDATDGLILEAANGTDIGILGAANTANVTWEGSHNYTLATADTIAAFGASKTLSSLSTTTYPSLTELSYVKGVTSSIQTQINAISGITYTRVEITTGDLAPSATHDVQLISITYDSGLIDFATVELTAGTANMFKAALYDGDPSSTGVYRSALYGGDFVSAQFPSGETVYKTIAAAFGGATGVTSPVAFNSTDLWLRFTNADGSNNGTFKLIFRAREVPST